MYINNVGHSEWKPINLITNQFLNKMISINLKSVFWGAKAATVIGKKFFNNKYLKYSWQKGFSK